MSESRTYVFPETGNGLSNGNLLASILPSLQNRGLDTSYLMGLMSGNNNGGFFGNNGGFQDIIALIVIAAIFGNGNFGFGGWGNNNNNSTEREMIMSAIQRNGVDLSQLASSLNCSVGRIDDAIGQVSSQICALGNQMGQNTNQIITALMQGNNALTSQLASCCCDLKQLVSESNYLTERGFCNTNQIMAKGFSDLGYASANQTCELKSAIKDSTDRIIDGQRAAEMREMQREITERDRRIAEQATAINNYQQTQTFGAMITQATQPIATAVNNLQSDVDGIKCRLPKTEVIPATPEYLPVNRSINVGYAPYCTGFNGFGGWGWNGFNGNCGNSLWG
jgi:hypothetical protein